jgi:hypothetical protein
VMEPADAFGGWGEDPEYSRFTIQT